MKRWIFISIILIAGCVNDSMVDQVVLQDTECEEFGGEIVDLMECDGSINQVCVMRNQQCYIEDFKNGKCISDLTPKVLCDTDQ